MKVKKLEQHSIKLKVTFFLLFVVSLPTAFMFALAGPFIYREFYEQKVIEGNERLQIMSQYIGGYIRDLTVNIDYLLEHEEMESLLGELPYYEEWPDHGEDISCLKTDKQRELYECLKNIVEVRYHLSDAFILTEDGGFLSVNPSKVPVDHNPRDTLYYREALKNPETFHLSNPYVLGDSNEKMITLTKGIKNDDQVVGVVGINMSLDCLKDLFVPVQYRDNANFMIINQEGKVVVQTFSDNHNHEQVITEQIPFEEIMVDPDGYKTLEINGQECMFVEHYDPYTQLHYIEWIAIKDMMQFVNIYLNIAFGVLVLLFGAMVYGSIRLYRQIMYPLNEIAASVSKTSRLEEYKKCSYEKEDELGIIAQQLNKMMERIQKDQRLLEQKEMKYQFLVNATNDIIIEIDVVNKQLSVKKKLSETSTLYETHSNYEGVFNFKKVVSFIEQHMHPEDQTKLINCFEEKSYKKCICQEVEYRTRNNQGNYVWEKGVFIALKDENEEVIQIIGYVNDIQENKKREMEILNRAQKDSLTGLYNRRSIEDAIKTYLQQEGEHKLNAMVFIDLDNFKQVNDTLGHQKGDEVLKKVTELLKTSVREEDLIGRLGGDEFIIFFKNIPEPRVVEKRVQRILEAFNNKHEADEGVTVSLGVVMAHGKDETYEALLKKADAAMYEAKKKGKNQYVSCLSISKQSMV